MKIYKNGINYNEKEIENVKNISFEIEYKHKIKSKNI